MVIVFPCLLLEQSASGLSLSVSVSHGTFKRNLRRRGRWSFVVLSCLAQSRLPGTKTTLRVLRRSSARSRPALGRQKSVFPFGNISDSKLRPVGVWLVGSSRSPVLVKPPSEVSQRTDFSSRAALNSTELALFRTFSCPTLEHFSYLMHL